MSEATTSTLPQTPPKPLAEAWRELLPGWRLWFVRGVLAVAAVLLVCDVFVPSPLYGYRDERAGWPIHRAWSEWGRLDLVTPVLAVDAPAAFAVWCGVGACTVCLVSPRVSRSFQMLCGGLLAWHAAVCTYFVVMYNLRRYVSVGLFSVLQSVALVLWPIIFVRMLIAAKNDDQRLQIGLREGLLCTAYFAFPLLIWRIVAASDDILDLYSISIFGRCTLWLVTAAGPAIVVGCACRLLRIGIGVTRTVIMVFGLMGLGLSSDVLARLILAQTAIGVDLGFDPFWGYDNAHFYYSHYAAIAVMFSFAALLLLERRAPEHHNESPESPDTPSPQTP